MKFFYTTCASLLAILYCVSLVQAQSTDSTIYLPFVSGTNGLSGQSSNTLTVEGSVLSSGAPMTAVIISLWRINPSIAGTDEIVDLVSWESSGEQSFTYQFTNIPQLEEGYHYYVAYINLGLTPGFLDAWYTARQSNPTEGTTLQVPAFDIADVTLRAPDNGATKSLPENFKWNERTTTTDSYAVRLFETDADGRLVRSLRTDYLPHPTDNANVGTMPPNSGFLPNVPYQWRVLIRGPFGGTGYSLEARTITLKNATSH